jgi:hypothetical protein
MVSLYVILGDRLVMWVDEFTHSGDNLHVTSENSLRLEQNVKDEARKLLWAGIFDRKCARV